MSYTVSEEQIEQDELNQHECMLPLMRLIDHMQHNKITPEVPQVLIHTTTVAVLRISKLSASVTERQRFKSCCIIICICLPKSDRRYFLSIG